MDVEALKKEMPVLDEMTQRSVCGGSGDFEYTKAQYESMLGRGSWKGGIAEGMGFESFGSLLAALLAYAVVLLLEK